MHRLGQVLAYQDVRQQGWGLQAAQSLLVARAVGQAGQQGFARYARQLNAIINVAGTLRLWIDNAPFSYYKPLQILVIQRSSPSSDFIYH